MLCLVASVILNLLWSLGKLSTCSTYTELMPCSRGPGSGYMDRYTTTCKEIAYVLHIPSICYANVCSRTDTNFRATYSSVFHRVISHAQA
jgi:hypothetical protein